MESPFITTIISATTVMIGDGSDVRQNGLKSAYKNIIDMDIPEKIDGKDVTVIGQYALYGCRSIQSIKLPTSLIEVRYAAFDCCYANIKLLDLSILPNLKKLYRFAFSSNNIERIKIGSFLSFCEEGVFAGNSVLEEIEVDENNKWFVNDYQGSFYNKKRDLLIHVAMNKSAVSIPHEVKTIGYMAFYGSKIKSLVIPSTVISIKGEAFIKMKYLEEIVFYCSLRKIKYTLFTWTTVKSLVYMRREQVNYNIFGAETVESIITCSQYAGSTFANKDITDKIGMCSVPKLCTPRCKPRTSMNSIFVIVLLIYY